MIGVIWEITQNYNLWRQSKTQSKNYKLFSLTTFGYEWFN